MVKTYLYTQLNGKLAKATEANWWQKTLSIFSSFIKRTLYDIQNFIKFRRFKNNLHNRNTQQRSTCETSKKYS